MQTSRVCGHPLGLFLRISPVDVYGKWSASRRRRECTLSRFGAPLGYRTNEKFNTCSLQLRVASVKSRALVIVAHMHTHSSLSLQYFVQGLFMTRAMTDKCEKTKYLRRLSQVFIVHYRFSYISYI